MPQKANFVLSESAVSIETQWRMGEYHQKKYSTRGRIPMRMEKSIASRNVTTITTKVQELI